MNARLLDGTAVAADIRESLRARAAAFEAAAGRPAGLGVVLVGDNPASKIYVRTKLKMAADLGLRADLRRLPPEATLEETVAVVDALNRDETYDGILVQAPLPEHFGSAGTWEVFDSINPAKDVDGFHPVNTGRLVQNRADLAPCTPLGIVELLQRAAIPIAGRHAVIIGRSDIVGKPMAFLLLHRHATVTICHSRTPGLPRVAATADILVAALGRAAFVTTDFVKPGATVVDVGINRLTDREQVNALFPEGHPRRDDFEKRGSIVVGDVHPEVCRIAGALTPVPGGVGPLTVAMLLSNTLRAAEARRSG
jgi:methylenetetrahydrofolate dehydrogenase (NADP+) / methenyltetrahydrofolate cyclohydrolase